MQAVKRSRWSLGIATALGLAFLACKGTMNVEAGAELAGQKGNVKFSYDGRDVNADKLPGSNRADVAFFDANGNKVPNSGATGVAPGDKVPVPPGAQYCEISGPSAATSCTGCGTGGSGGGSGGGIAEPPIDGSRCEAVARDVSVQGGLGVAVRSVQPEKWIHVFTLDADIDGSTAWGNVSGSFFVVGATGPDELHARIAGILFGGHGTPVPSGVAVDTLVRFMPEALGGRLYVADRTTAFTSFSMDWNGLPYAALGSSNTAQYAAANGWQVLEVFVPLSAFDITVSGGSSNSLDLFWTTSEDTVTNELHQAISYS